MRRLLAALLAVMMLASVCAFTVNAYEGDGITVLEAYNELGTDYYVVKFSEPVHIFEPNRIWRRMGNMANGTLQTQAKSVEYIGEDAETVDENEFSSVVRIKYSAMPIGFDAAAYGLSFTEYGINNKEVDDGYLSQQFAIGKNGDLLKRNATDDVQDFIWIPTDGADGDGKFEVHLGQSEEVNDDFLVLLSAKVLNEKEIELTFSDKITRFANTWNSIRYTDASYALQRDESLEDPYLQWPVSLRYNGTNKMIVKYTGETPLADIVTMKGYEDKAWFCTICIEGLPGDAVEHLPGYVDEFKTPDGSKSLFATNIAPAGVYDDVYMLISDAENATVAFTEDTPLPEPESVEEGIVVKTDAQLRAAIANYQNSEIKLGADIVMNDIEVSYADGVITVTGAAEAKIDALTGAVTEGSLDSLTKWSMFPNLNGNTINGQGYTIKGFYCNGSGNCAMFGELRVGEDIGDLNFEDVLILSNGGNRIGTVGCYVRSDLTNVKVDGVVLGYGNAKYVGGVMSTILSTTKVDGEVREELHNANVNACVFTGAVIGAPSADVSIGGIAGRSDGGTIRNSVNYGDIVVLSGTTYAAGGVIGLAEMGGGPLNNTDKLYTAKPMWNTYFYNNANYGDVVSTTAGRAGGIIGYADAIWCAGGSMRIENNLNAGNVTNGSALTGRAQNVSGYGRTTGVVYNSMINVNPDVNVAWSNATQFNGAIVGNGTPESAENDLNDYAKGLDGAYAWTLVEGKLLPTEGADFPEETTAPAYTYDPEREIAILSVEMISSSDLKITFSEPVKYDERRAQAWVSMRYCTVNPSGLAQYITGGDAFVSSTGVNIKENYVLQVGSNNLKLDGTNVGIWHCDTNLMEVVSGRYFGEAYEDADVLFCIEGLPINGEDGKALGFDVNTIRYIDNITSLDGSKKLVANKPNPNGQHDGVYVEVLGRHLDDPAFTVPVYDPETEVALLFAELAAPNALKITFSEPVQVTAKMFSSVRYCTTNFATGRVGTVLYDLDENGKNDTSKPWHRPKNLTKTADLGEPILNEDGTASYIVAYGTSPLYPDYLNGTFYEEDNARNATVYFMIEGLALPDGAENIVGYIDGITSLDGSKLLKATPYKSDEFRASEGAPMRGVYDGAYVFIAPHTEEDHVASYEYDEDGHWASCELCGTSLGDPEEHVFDNDCDEVCNVCGYERTVEHNVGDWQTDETKHWHVCADCEKILDEEEHEFDNECDDTCNICGYERTIEHQYGEDWTSDSTGHWHECSVCGDKGDFAEHTFVDGVCSVCGANDYVLGDLNGDEAVTADDAIYLLYHVFFEEDYPVNQPVDFDGDETVTANDAIYLLYHVFFPEDYAITRK